MKPLLLIYLIQTKLPKTKVEKIPWGTNTKISVRTKTQDPRNASTYDVLLNNTSSQLDNGIKPHTAMIKAIIVQRIHQALFPEPYPTNVHAKTCPRSLKTPQHNHIHNPCPHISYTSSKAIVKSILSSCYKIKTVDMKKFTMTSSKYDSTATFLCNSSYQNNRSYNELNGL